MRKKVMVIFGGKSYEHDISIITAMQVIENIDTTKYAICPVYRKDGKFYAQALNNIRYFVPFDSTLHTEVMLIGGKLWRVKGGKLKLYYSPAIVLNCCHGGEGEDGTLAALFELNNLPSTSCEMAQSAVCMDKTLSKQVFQQMMLNVAKYTVLTKREIFEQKEHLGGVGATANTAGEKAKSDGEKNTRGRQKKSAAASIAEQETVDGERQIGSNILGGVEKKLRYPMIVKPARLGSSIGISAAHNRDELQKALLLATEFDEKAVVEEMLTGIVEVNCAALTAGGKIVVSQTETPLSAGDFLTFEQKYGVGGKGASFIGEKPSVCNQTRENSTAQALPTENFAAKNDNAQCIAKKTTADGDDEQKGRIMPAAISEDLNVKIRELTSKIYQEMELSGVVRMDYLVDTEREKVYVNEINTIPGSLAFYLFEPLGMDFSDVLTAILRQAEQKFGEKERTIKYQSNVLQGYCHCGEKYGKGNFAVR